MNLVQTQILDCPADLTELDAQSSLMMGWVLTDHATVCPAGSLGPCAGAANSSPNAATSWPVTTP